MILAIIGVIYVGYYKSTASSVIRVASGERDSHYFELGKEFKRLIETHSDYKVELVEAGDSSFNRGAVQSGKADIALLAPNATEMTNLSLIAPITTQYVHVIVKEELNVDSVKELVGRRIALGGDNSDHRKAAYKVLEHYKIEEKALRNTMMSHLQLLESDELDGAIVLTGLQDEYISKLLASGNFKLLSVNAAEGLADRSPYFDAGVFPVGVYPSVFGPMPSTWSPTLTEKLWLVSRNDFPEDVINVVLDVMETKDFALSLPLFNEWKNSFSGKDIKLPIHETSLRRVSPYETLKTNVLDVLLVMWNAKWMILFVIILLVNARSRWIGIEESRKRAKQSARTLRIQTLLEDINAQEREQADAKDFRLLTQHLAEVRRIKSEGINIAKEQKMSDSAIFLSFLQQCDHVSRDIQWKLSLGMNNKNNVN